MTSTDLVAVGVLHAAYSLGRTVPDELSVVGFDDLLLAAHTVPALTTLRMPIAEIVNESVELAIGFARDPGLSRAPRTTVFKPTLVVRQSTGRPRGADDADPAQERRGLIRSASARFSQGRRGRPLRRWSVRPGSRPASPRPIGSPT